MTPVYRQWEAGANPFGQQVQQVQRYSTARRAMEKGLGTVVVDPTSGDVWKDGAHGDQAPIYAEHLGSSRYELPQMAGSKAYAPWENPIKYEAALMGQSLGVYVMPNGKVRAGMDFIERNAELVNNGASLPSIYEAGQELDVQEIVDHLRVVKLLPEVLGRPMEEFHAEKAFRHEMAPYLDFRMTVADPWVGGVWRAGPETEPVRSRSRFYEGLLTCRKDRETVGHPVETRMRANQFDPHEIDRKMAMYNMNFKRNWSCLLEFDQIGNYVNNAGEHLGDTYSAGYEKLPDIGARYSNSGTSENNMLEIFSDIMNMQYAANKVTFGVWVVPQKAWLRFTQNDFTRSGGEFGRTPVALPYGGMMQVPTLPGVRVVVDPRLRGDRMYMLDPNTCMWFGQGPTRVEAIEHKSRQTMFSDITVWYDAYCIHRGIRALTSRRFGCTILLHSNDTQTF